MTDPPKGRLFGGLPKKSLLEPNLHQLTPQTIEYLKSWLGDVHDLEWDAQGILAQLGSQDISVVFDVLWSRISREDRKESRKRWLDHDRYSAIPYHLNPQLRELIWNNKKSSKYVMGWFSKLDDKYSASYWSLARFLKEMDPLGHGLLETLIDTGKPSNLKKAVRLISKVDRVDTDLIMRIASKTSDKKILNEAASTLFSTGVVSGEDGIARAHEARAESLQKYLKDKNKGVRAFAKETIVSLQKNADKERQDAMEEKRLRQIEFEK